MQANLQFPCQLKQAAPLKKSLWIDRYHAQLQDRPDEMTSNIARGLYTFFDIDKVIPGMLFRGGHDDRVLVTYKAQYIVPIEYAYHPVGKSTSPRWTRFDASAYVRHMQTVGTLIRTPTARKVGDSAFSSLYQKLGERTHLDRREIIKRFSRITSLASECKEIQYKPVFTSLPESLRTLIKEKFTSPESEFYTLITPLLDKRLADIAEDLCWHFQDLPFVSITCRVVKTTRIEVTYTFPQAQSVLGFMNFLLSDAFYDMTPMVNFLHADTPNTREYLAESILEKIMRQKLLLPMFSDFVFQVPLYLPTLTLLVQQAPATNRSDHE